MLPLAPILVGLSLSVASGWEPLLPGLDLSERQRGEVSTVAVRLDPSRFRLRVRLARELGRTYASARELAEVAGALVAVNGGFFDPAGQPVGLRVAGGKVVAGRLRPGLGALAVVGDRVLVGLGRDFAQRDDLAELVQCGPRLVVGGAPNRLKPQLARRTAAGIDPSGNLVLVVTRSGAVEAADLAAWLAAPEAAGGYGLSEALNLDGGGSTQLFLRAGGRVIEVPGAGGVSDALVVLPAEAR